MMKYLEDLTQEELDRIREIASIGCGHSASALSNLLNRNIKMEVPRVRVVALEEAAYILLDDENKRNETVAGLLMDTATSHDDFPIDVVILLDRQSLDFIFESVAISDETSIIDLFNLSDMEESLIKEIGNILILNLVSALETFTQIKIRPERGPLLSIDIAEALINSIIMKDGDIPSMILVENRIFSENREINALSLLLPSEKMVAKLMDELFT